MPLSEKGEKIMGSMQKEYGPEKGKQVFYASKNAGRISGVDREVMTGGHSGGLEIHKLPQNSGFPRR